MYGHYSGCWVQQHGHPDLKNQFGQDTGWSKNLWKALALFTFLYKKEPGKEQMCIQCNFCIVHCVYNVSFGWSILYLQEHVL